MMQSGTPLDAGRAAARLKAAVGEIVEKQVQLGVDVVDDGEMSTPGFHPLRERAAGRVRAER